jgi:hypothetical protein
MQSIGKRVIKNALSRSASSAATAPRRAPYVRATPSTTATATASKPPAIDSALPPGLEDDVPPPTVDATAKETPSTSYASTAFPSGSTFPQAPIQVLSTPTATGAAEDVDWQTSFHGISTVPFSQKQAEVLMRPLEPREIEIKPGTPSLSRLSRLD